MPLNSNARKEPRWELTQGAHLQAPTFLPAGISREGWIDITTISDPFRVFVAPSGKVHRGADYYKIYLEELKIPGADHD
jgi:hypothetical protein